MKSVMFVAALFVLTAPMALAQDVLNIRARAFVSVALTEGGDSLGGSVTVPFRLTSAKKVFIRTNAVAGGSLSDPFITLLRIGGAVLDSNDNFGAHELASEITQFTAQNGESLRAQDAGMIVDLGPGLYAAVVSKSSAAVASGNIVMRIGLVQLPTPFDGSWAGTAVATTARDSSGFECPNANFSFTVVNGQLNGVATDTFGDSFALTGDVSTGGQISFGGGAAGIFTFNFSGVFLGNMVSGTWLEPFGCTGIWNGTRNP